MAVRKKDVSFHPPECCDMRGMLSFHILWLLSKKSMHGQKIAEELGKRKGFKPSPGTIYPALKELKRRGLIKGEKRNKIVVYTLTAKGKAGIEVACAYFCRCFGEIFREHRAFVSRRSI